MTDGDLLFGMLVDSCKTEFDTNTLLVFKDYLLDNVTSGAVQRFFSRDSKICLVVFNYDMDDGDSYCMYFYYMNSNKFYIEYERCCYYVVREAWIESFGDILKRVVNRKDYEDTRPYGGRFV